MNHERHMAGIAWAGFLGGIALYDVIAPEGETLSEGVDRGLEHPVGKYATVGAIIVTAAHLLNLLPEKFDPFHQALKAFKG